MLDKREHKKILSLQVYCTMKNRGCEWKGSVEQLESHTNSCSYGDIECPSQCGQRIERRNVEEHLKQSCPLREHTCLHCNFKATYKVVTEEHQPVCTYYPVKCPNQCGVSCEREVLEDHLKICSKEKVSCRFGHVGCPATFLREEEDKHMEDVMTHLFLMATSTHKMSEELDRVTKESEQKREEFFQEKLKEQREMQEAEFKQLLKEQEMEYQKALDLKLSSVEQKLKQVIEDSERDKKALLKQLQQEKVEQEAKLQEMARNMLKEENRLAKISCHISELQYNTSNAHWLPITMSMPYFDSLKSAKKSWYSPTIYTHFGGYAFCIVVRPSGGREIGYGTHICIYFKPKPGDYDDALRWPVNVSVTLELLNQNANEGHLTTILESTLYKKSQIANPHSVSSAHKLISLEELYQNRQNTLYLKDDCIQFRISKASTTHNV